MEFFKEVKNVNGKAKKRRFKEDRITSPFYFFLKIKEIEDNGAITVRFYEGTASPTGKGAAPPTGKAPAPSEKKPVGGAVLNKKITEKSFEFGKPGKYYEYVIFFDRVEALSPGKYRYAIFYNNHLIYEDRVEVKGNRESGVP